MIFAISSQNTDINSQAMISLMIFKKSANLQPLIHMKS
jgi:hypothetical protein